jgi:hypothetical protein
MCNMCRPSQVPLVDEFAAKLFAELDYVQVGARGGVARVHTCPILYLNQPVMIGKIQEKC